MSYVYITITPFFKFKLSKCVFGCFLPHRLHQHLSDGVLCPDFWVCELA